MRNFLELLQEYVNNNYDISHNALDNLEKNKYYVKKNNGEKILFLFDNTIEGLCLKIITIDNRSEYHSNLPLYNLSEDELINQIKLYCEY